MNADHILQTLNNHSVEYILIGGLNFMFNHSGPNTFDVDIFIRDSDENLRELNFALQDLACEWVPGEQNRAAVPGDPAWLKNQAVSCLTSPHGAIVVFRAVKGLEDGFEACKTRAEIRSMPNGEFYYSLSDEDMLRSQEVLPEKERKKERMATLKAAIACRKARGGEK